MNAQFKPEKEKKRGRPTNKSARNVRDSLIEAARLCFIEKNYQQVTTREVATRANSTMAMIHYYFGNKEGLFQAMFIETFEPVHKLVQDGLNNPPDSFVDFFKRYYALMAEYPGFVVVILKCLLFENGPLEERFIHERIREKGEPMEKMLKKMQQKGVINPELDPKMLHISMVSLMNMPFLMEPNLEATMGIKPDRDFWERMAIHQCLLLEQGCLKK
ncbi:transcriptional regulator, TetR family [Oceanospirillum multiglobuliferum]|uniref:HTH tetR-type domain-containing protein n=1 Tax=Oceanospirillum multiglobuliferum TaxID=64969 RepID=A0A1T4S3P3_9GAMM|nr:TetR/AcrR family transcriptional regulator [Oceanospirillum multiglobuliferum]OPX54503.1 hypothetical protein BTE48_13975 [Oceanospirillum multiglobuliferum]SKA22726.1 transcriptional regulator, TetR family [Oceanospirillum multiglobuliferum]